MEEEDDEVTDGLTVNLINDTHITVPKGIKLTNKGKIYVDGTSSIKVCRDDYEGDEADIYGEGEIPFDCEEEPEILPAETPEQENPATVDGIFIAFGVLGASMLGLLAAIGVLSFIERRARGIFDGNVKLLCLCLTKTKKYANINKYLEVMGDFKSHSLRE